ncbi:MAG: hypothetical protein IKA00_03200 [Prevotella sp.]|nr:hypothetical protein [Prevotella sp.]
MRQAGRNDQTQTQWLSSQKSSASSSSAPTKRNGMSSTYSRRVASIARMSGARGSSPLSLTTMRCASSPRTASLSA